MKTREEIITSMCYTWRHDYGLERREHDGPGGLITAGLTDEERRRLWLQMAQVFDNNIAPLLDEFKGVQNGDSIVLPKNREHAEYMVKVGMFYLEKNK